MDKKLIAVLHETVTAAIERFAEEQITDY